MQVRKKVLGHFIENVKYCVYYCVIIGNDYNHVECKAQILEINSDGWGGGGWGSHLPYQWSPHPTPKIEFFKCSKNILEA